MNSSKVENLIVKYLTNEATSVDLDFLSKWIEKPENEKFFYDYVNTHYEVTTAMSGPDIESIKNNLRERIKKDKNPFYRYRINTALKYAAVITVSIGVSYLYQKSNSKSPSPIEVVEETILIPKEEAITIQLDDGTIKTINANEETEIRDSKGNLVGSLSKSKVVYSVTSNIEKLVYNTIKVPFGKRFDVILSDGTHVFLNAGTSLRYPVKFIEGLQRDVYLKGEAYFNVTENKEHPFIVHADKMNVEVLGTEFNISHYSEDQIINTVLVEGSVQIYSDSKNSKNTGDSIRLKPGFKAEWNKSRREIEVDNVDTRIYTAWIEGKLIFRNATFLQIRNRLERHYNVTIKNGNVDLDAQLFDATFDIETIDEVLETLSKSYAIEYNIVNNEVLIK